MVQNGRFVVIGFAVERDSVARAQLEAIAAAGGGVYLDAGNGVQLNQVLLQASTGRAVGGPASGGGASVRVPQRVGAQAEMIVLLAVTTTLCVFAAVGLVWARRRRTRERSQ